MDFEYLSKLLKILIEGAGVSVRLFTLTLIFSIPLGMLVALGKQSKIKILKMLLNFYISIMRGTPLMLQLIFFYFVPPYLFEISIDRFWAAVIAFSVNYAAYFAEIFRGGIESMPIGQHEAAASLGYTKSQTFFRIILPQVIKRIIPSCSNEVITLIKDTALAQTIAVAELFTMAQKQASYKTSIMPIVVAGLFYYIMNLVMSVMFSKVEKKLDYYK